MANQTTFNTTTIAFIIIGILIGAGGGYFYSSSTFQPQIDELEDQATSFSSQIASQTTTITSLEIDIDDYETQVDDLESEVSTLETLNDNLESQVSTLESQASTLESEKTTMENENNDLTTQVSDLKDQLEDAEDTIDSRDREISSLNRETSSLEDRLGDRLEWKIYNKYGILFEYPADMELTEIITTETLGVLTGVSVGETEEEGTIMTLVWAEIPEEEFVPDLMIEEVINELRATDPAYASLSVSMYVDSSVGGHDMRYGYFYVSDIEGDAYGIIGSWYCTLTGRSFYMAYLTSNEDVFTEYARLMDNFDCHEGLGDSVTT